MTNLALTTAGYIHVVESLEQATLPALEAILAGAPVRIGTTGKFQNGNGTDATEAGLYGIALRSVAAGESLTALKHGVLDGYALAALAYNAKVYLSDTDGTLADAAGTVSLVIGRVMPGWSQTLGTAADKLLLVDL